MSLSLHELYNKLEKAKQKKDNFSASIFEELIAERQEENKNGKNVVQRTAGIGKKFINNIGIGMQKQFKYGTVFHGDAREIIPTLEKIDHVITDPPYFIKKDNWTDSKTTENIINYYRM